jgi:hypothetical protein
VGFNSQWSLKQTLNFVFSSILIMTDTSIVQSNGLYEIEDYEYKTPHYERCRQLSLADPVHTVVLKDYLQTQLTRLRGQIGDISYKELMGKVDETTRNDLQEFVDLGC